MKADWDNLSGEVRDESSSLEECRSLCEADSECMQFTMKDETCSTSKTIKLGQKSDAVPMTVNSGWMMDRVSKYMTEMDASCWDQTWIQP